MRRLAKRIFATEVPRAVGVPFCRLKQWRRRTRIVAAALGVSIAAIGLWASLVGLGILDRPFGDGDGSLEDLEGKVDRLAEYLADLPSTDNEKLKAEYEASRLLQLDGYIAQDAEKHGEAIVHFTAALPLAENHEQRAALYILRGNSYDSLSEYEAAEDDYAAALDVVLRFQSDAERDAARSAALGNLGTVYFHRGDLDSAEEFHKRALAIHKETGNQAGQAKEFSGLGLVYAARGDLDDAENQHKEALIIYKEIGDRLGEAAQLGNLGTLYRHGGDLSMAEDHFTKALVIEQEIGDKAGEAKSFGSLGNVYLQRGELDRAEEQYNRALAIHTEINNRLDQANDLGNLGSVYMSRGDPNTAEQYFNRALAIEEEIGNKLGQAHVLGNLGMLAERQGNLDEARELLLQAEALYETLGAKGEGPENVRRALERLGPP